MTKDIGCFCEECHHNKEKKCHADAITVKSSGDKIVNGPEGTYCHTFAHKQEI